MNTPKTLRRPVILLIALLTVFALAATAFAAGSYVVYRVTAYNASLPDNGSFRELLDMEPDLILPYEVDPSDGSEIIIDLDPDVWMNQAK